MPGFDGTGPMGQGPMTGGGGGYCAVPVRGAAPFGFYGRGRGYGGRGRGAGRGWRHWYYATGVPGWMRAQAGAPAFGGPGYGPAPYGYGAPYAVPKEEELAALKDQLDFFKSQMEDLQARIREMEDQPSDQGA